METEPLRNWPPSQFRLCLNIVREIRESAVEARWALEEELAQGVETRSFVRIGYDERPEWRVFTVDFSPLELPLTDPRHPFHVHHMGMALAEAGLASDEDEVPVGAIIVSWQKGVLARAHNQREQLHDPTAHAEMIAITQAANALRSWRLEECALYVTLEPCPMCAGAIVQARLPLVVYGCTDPKAGACHTLYQIASDPRLNHRARVLGGVLADRCAAVLSDFFAAKRQRRKDEG